MDRRQFLTTIGWGAAALGGQALAASGRTSAISSSLSRRAKNWAWLRGGVTSLDDWRRSLARMKGFGIDAVPAAAAEGLELHAWMPTMMRAEYVAAHPEWYAVSRRGVSTAVKSPYVDYYNGFYKEDVPWIERATREGIDALRGRIPLYTGLYVPDLSPADLARAAGRALAGGAQGISVFQGNTLTPEHWNALGPVLSLHRTLA